MVEPQPADAMRPAQPGSGLPWLTHFAPTILFADEDVLVVDKPAGIVCQSVHGAHSLDLPGLLKEWLASRRDCAVGDVYLGTHQRLDQDTSGCVLYTVRKSANKALADQFAARSIEKVYVAAVSGEPPRAGSVLVHWLVPAERGSVRVAGPHEQGAKEARTRVLAVRSVEGRSLLTLAIDTGRTHQVRVQLAAVGCPVAGDARYGGARALRLLLHAQQLSFRHPSDGRQLHCEAALPFEFEDWLGHGVRSVFSESRVLERAIALAAMRRHALGRLHATGQTTAFRLVNDAADGLPGFSVDLYEQWLIVRVDGEGEQFTLQEQQLVSALAALPGVRGIYVKRHPKQANQLIDPTEEAIAPRLPVWGEPAPEAIVVRECGVPFAVRLGQGLRTGLFLDQRDNRERLRELAPGKRVLNLFAYTGSFSVVALMAGADSVTSVDSSRTAVDWAQRNVERIGCGARHHGVVADAFDALRHLARAGERFDIVIVDPPSYSTSKRGRFRAKRDYVALCVAACSVLAEPGTLLACINHQGVSRLQLRRFIQDAARQMGREPRAVRDLATATDFPAEAGHEPAMKGVLVEFPKRSAFRSPSAGMRPRRFTR